jgi:hypothetical protein
MYLCEQGYEGLWLFFEANTGPRAKMFGKDCSVRHELGTDCRLTVVTRDLRRAFA